MNTQPPPGPTRTPTMDAYLESVALRLGIDVSAAADHVVHELRRLPLGRMNEPEDVAGGAVPRRGPGPGR
ncbi:hypothetical protein V2I01_33440 [Micromonospora sp. BRA006-A]|nr:hypothetical protein [Micromonospora sp. BRA006-A]